MKILIEIDDNDYADIITDSERNLNHYERLIKKGVPLPKGHGKLIDADKLPYEDIECTDGRTYMVVNAYDVDHASTIIEADKAESEE